MNAIASWLREASNFYTVIISFASALIIVLVVNIVFLLRRLRRDIKLVRTLFRHGHTVVLKRELLLPHNSIMKGKRGTVVDVLDTPRLKVERMVDRKIAIVDFNGTLVPLNLVEARRYLDLEVK